MLKQLTALALIAATSGCGALKALEGEPARDVFELRSPSAPKSCGRGRVAELVIEAPKASGAIDTDRIMIRPNALQVQYLPDARWGDTVPVMLQTLLVRGFGDYDMFSHVGRAPLGSNGDYALLSEVDDFNAVVQGSGATVQMRVSAQIVQEMSARVVARGSFVAQAPAASTKTEDLIPAFDAASQQLVGQMTAWGVKALGGNCR